MAAKKGNNYRQKFKEAEEREFICQEYLKHCAQGLSDDCFPHCDRKTIQSYVKKFPKEFPAQKIERANRERRLFWERLGIAGTIGAMTMPDGKKFKVDNFNTTAWIFNMKNRFGWKDRQDVTSGDKPLSAPNVYIPDNKRK